MKKFIKVIDTKLNLEYKEWFLVYEGFMEYNFKDQLLDNRIENIVNGKHDINLGLIKLNYENVYSKINKPLLIRQSGTYMVLNDDLKIIETKYCENYPLKRYAEVIVCENSANPDERFINYLVHNVSKDIVVLTNFRHRTEKELKPYFEKAKIVTFTTTFSDMDWFNKMLTLCNHKHNIIGNSNNHEIIEDLKLNSKIKFIEYGK